MFLFLLNFMCRGSTWLWNLRNIFLSFYNVYKYWQILFSWSFKLSTGYRGYYLRILMCAWSLCWKFLLGNTKEKSVKMWMLFLSHIETITHFLFVYILGWRCNSCLRKCESGMGGHIAHSRARVSAGRVGSGHGPWALGNVMRGRGVGFVGLTYSFRTGLFRLKHCYGNLYWLRNRWFN